jgi:hypothetical protein
MAVEGPPAPQPDPGRHRNAAISGCCHPDGDCSRIRDPRVNGYSRMFTEPGSGSFSVSKEHWPCQTKVLTVPTHLDGVPEAGHGIVGGRG